MRYSYAVNNLDKEKTAKAVGISLGISTKNSVEVCKYVRNKNAEQALRMLEDVTKLKKAVPFRRHIFDLAHKRKIGPGRYPVKTCEEIIGVIENAMSNAENKGLSREDLYIKHICAHLAATPWRYGRHARRKAKRTHIEVVLEERVPEEGKAKKAKKRVEPKKKEVVEQQPKQPKKTEQKTKKTKDSEVKKDD
ncbi:50S ribosomal protein L22 [Candidatus Woesearchaeota archaeon]|nr:50S ribosomal protein L22 [Candidatus Woesearchaeota archaeon]